MIEAAVGLVLITTGALFAAKLIYDSSVGLLYKSKLVVVTAEAAQLIQNSSANEAQATTFVEQAMGKLGLQANKLKVSVQPITLRLAASDPRTVAGELVTVSNYFPMLGSGADATSQLQISDTEFAVAKVTTD